MAMTKDQEDELEKKQGINRSLEERLYANMQALSQPVEFEPRKALSSRQARAGAQRMRTKAAFNQNQDVADMPSRQARLTRRGYRPVQAQKTELEQPVQQVTAPIETPEPTRSVQPPANQQLDRTGPPTWQQAPNYFGDNNLQNIKDPGLRRTIANQLQDAGTLMDPTELTRMEKLPGYRQQGLTGLRRELYDARQRAQKRANELAFIAQRDPRWAPMYAQAANELQLADQAWRENEANRTTLQEAGIDAGSKGTDVRQVKPSEWNSFVEDTVTQFVDPTSEYKEKEKAQLASEFKRAFPEQLVNVVGRDRSTLDQLGSAFGLYKAMQRALPNAEAAFKLPVLGYFFKGDPYNLTKTRDFLQLARGLKAQLDGKRGQDTEIKLPGRNTTVNSRDLFDAMQELGMNQDQIYQYLNAMPDIDAIAGSWQEYLDARNRGLSR